MGQQPVWIMIALVLDAATAVTGIFVGPGFNMTGLLAVGPLLACARCNGRMTALVAGYALVLCGVVAGVTGTAGSTMEWYRIASHYQSAATQARALRRRADRRRPSRPRRAPRPGVSYQTLPGGHFRNANGVAATGGQESRNGRPTSR
jgi:hypothetical protein